MCGIALWIRWSGCERRMGLLWASLRENSSVCRSASWSVLEAEKAGSDSQEWLYGAMADWWSALAVNWIRRRGPDFLNTHALASIAEGWHVEMLASVLAMRAPLAGQPHVSAHSFLCYNGEIYDHSSRWSPHTDESGEGDSDTELLHSALDATVAAAAQWQQSVASGWMDWESEASFVFADRRSGTLLFGKDGTGRKSLLIGHFRTAAACAAHPRRSWCESLLGGHVLISSVAIPGFVLPLADGGPLAVDTYWTELPPTSLYSWNLLTGVLSSAEPWETSRPRRKMGRRSEGAGAAMLATTAPRDLTNECLKMLACSISRRCGYRGHTVEAAASLAVLFSGGLDSAVLAALADDTLPADVTLDLITVSFGDDSDQAEQGGDRKAARKSYSELLARSAQPNRIRLILVNVTKAMMVEAEEHVRHLTLPLDTVMDASIAMPLWFAARGQGITVDGVAARTRARVVLMGSGADEQFGGYSRHRVAYAKGGNVGLEDELQMDMDRIWQRNLGRDDRVVADHGREGRFPFLDSALSSWLCSVPIDQICDMQLPPGTGDKLLLRQVAQRLRLPTAAQLVKRAVQFGSRLTKMVPKGKGTDKLAPE